MDKNKKTEITYIAIKAMADEAIDAAEIATKSAKIAVDAAKAAYAAADAVKKLEEKE